MRLKLTALVLLAAFLRSAGQTSYPHANINLLGFIDPETQTGPYLRKYSGCWGWYQDSTTKSGTLKVVSKKEYALVGSSTGTYFIDISSPATPTVCDYVPGKTGCTWRELKNYKNYCYVVSDDAKPNRFQIIDMQYLPDSVHVVHDDSVYFERAHTVWIDGNKMYCGGVTSSVGVLSNMKVYSLTTPTAPVLLRTLSDDYPSISYVHDMFVRNDTVYASAANQGLQVYHLLSNNTFTALGSLTTYTEQGYNHSSSITQNGKNLVFCDESPTGLSIKVADVSNLNNITISSLCKPNSNPEMVPHNPYVKGNKWAFVSCYQDGLNLYDISNPTAPVLAGYFDTYPQGGSNMSNNYGSSSYYGNWGAYPFFPSNLILACDMQNGVFILEANALVGVNENKIETKLNVFPNPAGNRLQINVMNSKANSYNFEIKNMLGQVVWNEHETASTGTTWSKSVDVSHIENGIYLISVSSGDKNFQQKIVISR